MKNIFVSYHHSDSSLVVPFVQRLQELGFDVWFDRVELTPGENWSSKIKRALQGAEVLLWFAGSQTEASSWVKYELTKFHAKSLDNSIIPILLPGAKPSQLPDFLQGIQWLDARENSDNAIDSLHLALKKLVKPKSKNTRNADFTEINNGYVFISYSIKNTKFLEELKKFLKAKGYGYWDFHENKRDYQAQFHLELESVILDAQAVLCIISPAWKISKWTPREYIFSQDVGKPIFLLKAEKMNPTLLIAGSSYIDFTSSNSIAFNELALQLDLAGL